MRKTRGWGWSEEPCERTGLIGLMGGWGGPFHTKPGCRMREAPPALLICMASCAALVKSLPLSELGIAHSLKQSSKPSRNERTIWETEAIRQSYEKLGIHKLRPSQAHSPACQLGALTYPPCPGGTWEWSSHHLQSTGSQPFREGAGVARSQRVTHFALFQPGPARGAIFQPASRELILWDSFTHLFIHSTNVYWAPAMYPPQS